MDDIRKNILANGIFGSRGSIEKAFSKDIEKARRTYNVGDISPVTGLQKQADGSWKPAKKSGKKSETKKKDENFPKSSEGSYTVKKDKDGNAKIVESKKKISGLAGETEAFRFVRMSSGELDGSINTVPSWGERFDFDKPAGTITFRGSANKLYQTFRFKNENLPQLATKMHKYLEDNNFNNPLSKQDILDGIRAYIDNV